MKFEKYYISDENGDSNCVVRSLCKSLNKSYDEVYTELLNIAKSLNKSFNDVAVFEEYMHNNNFIKIESKPDILVNSLKLGGETYIVFCYDKADYYHMFPIINNVIYDKNEKCLNLYVLAIYKYII